MTRTTRCLHDAVDGVGVGGGEGVEEHVLVVQVHEAPAENI